MAHPSNVDHVVRSSKDGGIVFDVTTVTYEAEQRRVTKRRAALILVEENQPVLTDEELFADQA